MYTSYMTYIWTDFVIIERHYINIILIMVNKCCVYGCKSNYEVMTKAFKDGKVKIPHVPTFSFFNWTSHLPWKIL